MDEDVRGPPLVSPLTMLAAYGVDEDEDAKFVVPGNVVSDAPQEFMRGHGTYNRENEIVSSLAGSVRQLNRLLMVKTIKQRYAGAVGDVVIGRIIEVQSKRWKVDVSSRLHSNLPLGSVLLPGGDFRRKDVEDQERMSEFLKVGELICAEVQQVQHDGTLMLHTRNNKYGKLHQGILVKVPPYMIKKTKVHLHTTPYNIDIVIGCNGNVWVAPLSSEGYHKDEFKKVPLETRKAIVRMAACVRLLRDYAISVYWGSVQACFEASQTFEVSELGQHETAALLAHKIAAHLLSDTKA